MKKEKNGWDARSCEDREYLKKVSISLGNKKFSETFLKIGGIKRNFVCENDFSKLGNILAKFGRILWTISNP